MAVLEKAKAFLSEVRTIFGLRQAQAVILPLEYGFSIEATAKIIGMSKRRTCQIRRQFIVSNGVCIDNTPKKGGRYRENMSYEKEVAFLAPFLEEAKSGGIIVVGTVKEALEKYLGRSVALASVYNLLHRHGWRKLSPDKRHPKADADTQDEWKKNSLTL
ncbi:MAG: winged helix-turn-helix domain-containing protein [Nitrospirae bacterium]|nr:winged helix-turn-helix domain-containing protein [Nitrospirota bacterium]